ncbi:hypothetical protein EV138_7215 [Kribbella voronezhensis]|uniref:Ig-like domain-containing protein n=1 Tax=Kribbella voronezhensis TaxID=2512212 RepID=A0A4R7SU22_9ACTN|nr:hypothetical protein [Kribbella voronezhensis]TDU82325.1 hypothetical protein EV138_7215 [Kribbella voronezhensis]
MFKKSLAGMVLVTALGVPAVAQAATGSAATVSKVELAWDSARVKVTWSESAAVANTITVTRAGQPAKVLGTTTATGANLLSVDPAAIGVSSDPASAAVITVTDSAGGEAKSAAFDTYFRTPAFTETWMNSRELLWSVPGDSAKDGTPNDPLDMPGPIHITPIMKFAGCTVKSQPSTTELRGTIPNQGRPFNLTLQAANEWGRDNYYRKQVRTSAVTLSAPASTRFGAAAVLSGKVAVRHIVESGSTCVEADDPDRARIQVSLQGRNSATSPWYLVSPGNTDAQGNYKVTLTTPGAREYRVWVNENSLAGTTQYASVSASRTVRATTALMSAKFITPTITYGAKPQAYIWVNPAGTQQAALQFLNASGTWQGVTTKVLSSGKGLVTFPWNRRGVASFRWWVGGSTHNGLQVDPIYTGPFGLTVN